MRAVPLGRSPTLAGHASPPGRNLRSTEIRGGTGAFVDPLEGAPASDAPHGGLWRSLPGSRMTPVRGQPAIPAEPVSFILLVRHGRTVLNAEGRFRGLEDPGLDETGRDEVSRVASDLRTAPLAAIYSSPLRRALETAGAIARPHHREVRVDPRLRDLDYGKWTGRTPEEVARADPDRFARFRADPDHEAPPGGENVASLRRRMDRSLRAIARRHVGETVVVVTHDIPIRVVRAEVARSPTATVWSLDVPTGSVWQLTVRDGSRTRIEPRKVPSTPVA